MSTEDDIIIAELIRVATAAAPAKATPIEKVVKKLTADAEKFVEAKQIKKGITKIIYAVLYKTYSNWAEANGETVRNNKAFGRQFSFLFERYRDMYGSYYLLDAEAFKEELNSAREKEEQT